MPRVRGTPFIVEGIGTYAQRDVFTRCRQRKRVGTRRPAAPVACEIREPGVRVLDSHERCHGKLL